MGGGGNNDPKRKNQLAALEGAAGYLPGDCCPRRSPELALQRLRLWRRVLLGVPSSVPLPKPAEGGTLGEGFPCGLTAP